VERTRRIRIGRLTTVGEVAAELGRLYRHARRGEIPVGDVSRLATILAVMRQCLEASELERRIAEMEAALAPAGSTHSVVPFRVRTRLVKLEAALRGRDPPDEPWICRRLIYDPREWEEEEAISRMEADELNRLPGAGELSEIDRERISRMKADELDRLVAAGEIGEIDRERVTFIIRTIVHPPERADDPLLENVVGRGLH
jgi:hypothetical protein